MASPSLASCVLVFDERVTGVVVDELAGGSGTISRSVRKVEVRARFCIAFALLLVLEL